MAASLDTDAALAKTVADANRMHGLAAILRNNGARYSFSRVNPGVPPSGDGWASTA
jgi:hypothetical protein